MIYIVAAPDSFVPEMEAMAGVTRIETDLDKNEKSGFILAFCTKQEEVDALCHKADKILEGDGLLWIAYPKGTSKKYTCEFNRDTGWATPGKLGFETVRLVAIDEDWSAMRFRRVEYIKKMGRSFAITEVGKQKAGRP